MATKSGPRRNGKVAKTTASYSPSQLVEKLRDGREDFRDFCEHANDLLQSVDASKRFIYVNRKWLETLGYSESEAAGLTLNDILREDQIPYCVDVFESVRTGQSVENVHTTFVGKDGREVHVEGNVSPRFENGEFVSTRGIFRDIGERKRCDEALRNTEDYYRALLDSSLDAIVILNADGSLRYLSPSYERVLGFSPDDRVGTGILERIHPDDAPRVAEIFAKFLEDRASNLHAEVRARHSDGSWRYIEAEGNNLLGDPVVNGIVVSMRDVTERKEAEKALKESEAKYRSLFGNMLNGFAYCRILVDENDRPVDFVYLEVNHAFERLTGLARENVVGRKATEAIPGIEKAHPELLDVYGRVALAGAEERFDIHFKPLDIWLSISAFSPARGHFVALFEDITERKRSEEALRDSEERYRLLAENVSDVIWILDLNLKSTYISPSVVHLRGYTAEEAVAGGIERILTPASIEVAAEALAEEWVLEETSGADPNRSWALELEMYRKDGSTIWTEVKLGFMRAGDGRPIGILGVTRDISERKKAEEALKASEERYRVVVDNAIEAILVAQDGMVKFLNPGTIAMTGYSEEEILSRPFAEFLHPEDREMVFDRHTKRLEGEETPSEYGFRVLRKDGETRWVEINVVRISWGRKPAGMIFLRDVTEKKQAEEERRRMEQQVQLAGRLAAVGELAAGVAHELNNPLASVQAYAQLLSERDDLDEAARSDVATVYGEALRASRITANLLSFARQHRPEKTFVSLNDILRSSLELQAYRLKVTNIEVVTELAPDLPKTMADVHQVQQVFVNLITNAEQAMTGAHGGGTLKLKTERTDGAIMVSVADDGPGVRQEDLKRIFDPFFTTKEVGKGTGLGLSICYGIVREHGGRISARNNPDRGATFTVELPIVSENEASGSVGAEGTASGHD